MLQSGVGGNYFHLKKLLAYAGESQAATVLVILPSPPQVRNANPEYAAFADLIKNAATENGSPNVWLLDMSDALGNGCFRDASHLKIEAAALCAVELKKRWPVLENNGK